MEIMDDRYGESSSVIVSELPVSEWYSVIGDSTVAAAILDRIVHIGSSLIESQGEKGRLFTRGLTEKFKKC